MTTPFETVREALEAAQNGLKWYRDAHPGDASQADDEMDAEIEEALTALSELERMAVEPVAWTSQIEIDWAKRNPGRAGSLYAVKEGPSSLPLYTAAPPAQQPQYEAGDMASAHNDGFRAGVASVAQQPQAEAVPEGYRIVPDWKGYALLGSGRYLINHAANYDPELGSELIITLATEKDREGGRKIGESRPNAEDSPPVQPDEMVIRIGFLNGDALFALEDQLADVRKVLEAAGKAAPQQAEAVPQDVGQLEYRGNSVAYIHQKMTAYRGAIDAAWQAMRDAGHPPDGCTPLAQAITKALAPQQAEAVPSDVVRDAERYRWLRVCNLNKFDFVQFAFDLGDEHLDNAIDIAIAQQKGGV